MRRSDVAEDQARDAGSDLADDFSREIGVFLSDSEKT